MKNLLQTLVIALFLLPVSSLTQAQVTKTALGGNWNVAGNWSPAGAPAANDFIIIPDGIVAILNLNFTSTNSITLEGNGVISIRNNNTLTIDNLIIFEGIETTQISFAQNNATVNINGTLITANSNGIISGTTGSIQDPSTAVGYNVSFGANAVFEFNGADQITNGLPAMVNELILSGTGTKTLGTVTVNGEFSMTNGVDAIFQNFTIGTTGSATIGESNKVNVSGTLANNAGVNGLVIEDGGSLISNNAVAGTMKWSPPSNSWHFLSAPVNEMQILGSDFAPDGVPTTFDFYYFKQAEELPWINLRAEPGLENVNFDEEFMQGKGYLVAYYAEYSENPPFAFKGSLNAGNFSNINLAYSENNEWAGWNLIGNPYPSGYNWGAADKTMLADVFAYIYDGNLENYVTIDDGFIAPGQGFFVLVEENRSFGFENNLREHGGSYTKDDPVTENLVLKLSKGDHFDQTVIRIEHDTDFSRDRRDAIKMFSFAAHMPQIYSYTSDQVQVAVNTVPHLSEDVEFTLGLRIPSAGEYTLSVNEINGVFQSGAVYLKDLKTGIKHNLSQTPEYSFQAVQGDDPARFIISFAQPTSVDDPENLITIPVFASERNIHVDLSGAQGTWQVQVFDLSGRTLIDRTLNPGQVHIMPLNHPGVYITRIIGHTGMETRKLILR